MQISRTLGRGTAGADVKFLVQQLSSLGYLTGDEEQVFGDSLEAAVIEFQKDHGLEGTGRVDGRTAAAIRRAIDELVPGSFKVDRETRSRVSTLHSELVARVDELHTLVARELGVAASRPYRQFTLTRVEKDRIEMKFDPGVEVERSSLMTAVPDVSEMSYIETTGVDPQDPAAAVVGGIARSVNSNHRPGLSAVCYIDPPGICVPCSVVIIIVVSRAGAL